MVNAREWRRLHFIKNKGRWEIPSGLFSLLFVETDLQRGIGFQGGGSDPATHRLHSNAMGGGLFQRSGKFRMGGSIGSYVPHARHLYHKQDTGSIALCLAVHQLLQMLDAPLGGGIRKKSFSIHLQGDTFDLQKPALSGSLGVKFKPGVSP